MPHPIWRTDVEEAIQKTVQGFAPYRVSSVAEDISLEIPFAARAETESMRVAATLVHNHAKALSGAVAQQRADIINWLENAVESAYFEDVFLTYLYMLRSPRDDSSSRIRCVWQEMSSDPLGAYECFPKELVRRTDAWRSMIPRHPDDRFQLLVEYLRKFCRSIDRVSRPKPPTESLLLQYEVQHSLEVEDSLKKHMDLFTVLRDAPAHIREEDCFPGAEVVLDVFLDPDADEEESGSEYQLVIVIKTSLPPDEAFKRYERLQASWWLERFVKFGDRLGLDLEFV